LAVVGSGRVGSARAVAFASAIVLGAFLAPVPGTASPKGDMSLAKSGTFVADDFPDGFRSSTASSPSHADNIKLAKGVAGCGPYVTLQKAVVPLPQAKSPRFADPDRTIGNEVDVFASERAASAALVLYAKSSIASCLEHLFEKQAQQDPDLRNSLDAADVSLEREDFAGLGDESVGYDGTVVLTGTDGSTRRIGVGSVVVRVGRAVDVITYSTTGVDLTDVLTPAIDASVARLRSVLTPTTT
jgi:hypothetical protein